MRERAAQRELLAPTKELWPNMLSPEFAARQPRNIRFYRPAKKCDTKTLPKEQTNKQRKKCVKIRKMCNRSPAAHCCKKYTKHRVFWATFSCCFEYYFG